MSNRSSIAVIGGGVAGIVSAYLLQNAHDVTLFEKNDYVGGHTHTITVQSGEDQGLPVDTGFIVMNDKTYPLFTRFLDRLQVQRSETTMSFSYYCKKTGLQYGSETLDSVFAQRKNIFRPSYWSFLYDIVRFFKVVKQQLYTERLKGISLADFLSREGFSTTFRDQYLLPMSAAIWSASYSDMGEFPMESFARFYENHGLLSVNDHPQWYFIRGGSHSYVKAFLSQFPGKVLTESPVQSVTRHSDGVDIQLKNGETKSFDRVVIAAHADEALALLSDPSRHERELLSAWRYSENKTYFHTDTSFLPPNERARSSWNAVREAGQDAVSPITVTYDMTRLQALDTSNIYCVTLNPATPIDPSKVIASMTYTHPIFDFPAIKTQSMLHQLNGEQNTWFCGSYFGYGFHEDAVRSAVNVGKDLGVEL